MMTEAPREMALDVKWIDNRVQVVLVHGDKALFSDTVDPRSDQSRTRIITKLTERFGGVDTSELDEKLLSMAAKGPPADGTYTGRSAPVDPDPEPSEQPVDGAELLEKIATLLRRHVVLPAGAAEAIALWVLHTYVVGAFEYTPRLLISSPTKRCGKTLLLRFLVALVSRPLACEGITAAAMFRSIAAFHPTLLLDEADTFLRGPKVDQELRGVCNSGFQRGGRVLRCDGDNHEPAAYPVFCPLVIGMIGRPPDTVEDRSITIEMRRKTKAEKVDRLRPGKPLRHCPDVESIRRRCVRWAKDNRQALMSVEPEVPSALDDRAADLWFGLIAIANAAGGSWPEAARTAAITLSADRNPNDGLGVQLLQDARLAFEKREADRLSSKNLIEFLTGIETSPWADYRNGKPIGPRQVARLLQAFDIRPRTIREPDDSTPKGYTAEDFEDAWRRYLDDPATPPGVESATAPHALSDKHLGPNPSATGSTHVADENGRNPLQAKACGAVADSTPGGTNRDTSDPPERHAERLQELVETMVADIADLGDSAPFAVGQLRAHYDELRQRIGDAAALADAQQRYEDQAHGEIRPLGGHE